MAFDAQFEIVEALYQEANATLPKEEQVEFKPQARASANGAIDRAQHNNQAVIQSRKPRAPHHRMPIETRISDLYEEAEATQLLAEEEAVLSPANLDSGEVEQAENAASDGSHLDKITDEFGAPLADETDFAIPAEFGASKTSSEPAVTVKDDVTDDVRSELNDALTDDRDIPLTDDTLSMSPEIEPAVPLDDVLEGLIASSEEASPEEALDNTEMTDAATEAAMLAALDAARPQADDALSQQLADVKSAVEQADISSVPIMAEAEPELESETQAKSRADEGLDSVSTGPALAVFIGETVREVLDEELPQMVRGLVEEALGERQGRYGRSETPHIGLRTKPSRH